MNCPHCNRKAHANGTTHSGIPRYRCRACGKSWTGNPTGRPLSDLGNCPQCGSSQTKRNGHGRGICNDCGKTWAI